MRGVTGNHAALVEAVKFQPALPMRGVTPFEFVKILRNTFQPALPMRGVTWSPIQASSMLSSFQPALPMRGVTALPTSYAVEAIFQPALPMRGVTNRVERDILVMQISTRTPHAGSDAEQLYELKDKY